jgi:hypothetical protein
MRWFKINQKNEKKVQPKLNLLFLDKKSLSK